MSIRWEDNPPPVQNMILAYEMIRQYEEQESEDGKGKNKLQGQRAKTRKK